MFLFGKNIGITIDERLSGEILSELWKGFCYRICSPKFTFGEENKISIKKASFIPLQSGDEYTVCIRKDGIGILGKDKNSLLRGFMMLMMCIEQLSEEELYCSKSEPKEAELIRSSLAPETVIADWQYNITEGTVKTSVFLNNKGYNTLICPWYDSNNINTCVNTAIEEKLYGVIETTWHTLSEKMHSLLAAARKFGLPLTGWSLYAEERTETATILRKISDKNKSYEECGFSAHQVVEGLL